MKNKKLFILSIISTLSIGGTIFSLSNKTYKEVSAYSNTSVSEYYKDIGYKSGTDLLNALRSLTSSKRRTLISYNSMFSYFDETDPGTYSGSVRSFYTGENCSRVSREHIWPYSKLVLNDNTGNNRGDNDIEKDLQMIRPADSSINEDRGNSFYTYNPPIGQGWDPGDPNKGLSESFRGEAARIIFYCVAADSGLSLVDKDYDSWQNRTMGKLSNLLEWNFKYNVTSKENIRNNTVERIQGHRNPFIDHPEYACKIWGNVSNATRAICNRHGYSGELDILSNGVEVEEFNMSLNKSYEFTASVSGYTPNSVSWKLVNENGYEYDSVKIASLSPNGIKVTVTPFKTGVTYLEATYNVSLSDSESETLIQRIKCTVTEGVSLIDLVMAIAPFKRNYYVGESLDTDGLLVEAYFSDGRVVDVTNQLAFNDIDFSTTGSKTVICSYTFEGVTLSVSYQINVSEKEEPAPEKKGCSGNIETTSIVLASIASFGVIILLTTSIIRRKKKHDNE